jgi:dynein heavy chain
MLEIRENYRDLGRIASILYFVVNDLSKIEAMYQFSLERYKGLFSIVIDQVENSNSGSENHQEKMEKIMEALKKEVYQVYSASLFSKDRLLLALSMSIALKKDSGHFD